MARTRVGLVGATALMTSVAFASTTDAGDEGKALQAGSTIDLEVRDVGLPPTLYTLMTGEKAAPGVRVWLPEDYVPEKRFPLVVYVPGNDGNVRGNIGNARALAGREGWIAATLPLFKKAVDREEVSGGVIVSFEDYPVLGAAYRQLLGRLFDTVPNIDRERSAMVGFSNGAMTIAVLVSNHDEFVLTHFRRFCLVDAGMFHLTDLHKARARGAQYLILVGDRPDLGRDLKLRGSALLQDEWRLLGVDLTSQVMKDTGHTFDAPEIELVRDWLRRPVPARPRAHP